MTEVITSPEKRRARRLRRKVKVILHAATGDFEGQIVDISCSGVRVLSTMPQAVLDELEVELLGADTKLRLPALVSWHREYSRSGSKWRSECGLRFAEEHSELPDFLFSFKGKALSSYLEKLSTIPTVILDLMAMLNDSRVSIAEISRKISVDQVLVAYLLKVINSPLYGFHSTISSVSQAVSLLGYTNLKSVFMSYFTQQLSHIAGNKAVREELWRHSLLTAVLARECAVLRKIPQEEAYIAGLLHDIGKPILITLDFGLFQESLRRSREEEKAQVDLEKEIFGFSHDVLAAYLMFRWNLDPVYSEAANFHHQPDEYPGRDPLVWNTALANALSHLAVDPGRPVPETYWKMTGINPSAGPELIEKSNQLLAGLL